MHPIIVDCVKKLEEVLESETLGKGVKEFETKKLMSDFTMDVIARSAFATTIDTYSDDKNEFILNAQKAFRSTWRIWVSFLLGAIPP